MAEKDLSLPAAVTQPRSAASPRALEARTVVEDVRANAESQRVGVLVDGRYRLVEVIGRGGMGTVYRAEQVKVGRDVALKTVRPSGDEETQADLLARFENEARLIAQLKHPNTLHLYDFGRFNDDELFLVTELLVGQTLEQRLAAGPLPPHVALRFAAELADALSEAHKKGIVHRDVKPRNVFLDRVGDRDVAKILDFGLARLSGVPHGTRAGQVLGTPTYVSPEQASGGEATPASDLYSLGITLYECLVGHPPFVANSAEVVLRKHLEERPLPPSKTGGLLPVELDAVIMSMLSKSPIDRPTSASALRETLLELERRLDDMEPPEDERTASNPDVVLAVQMIGRFQILGSIGRTPTSEVFRARDPQNNNREVALKVLTDRGRAQPQLVIRLKREAEALRELKHPNVVEVYEVGTTSEGQPFLAMELLKGRTLRQRLLTDGPLPPREAAKVLGQIASALSAVHARGFVHRDLKPGNVMLIEEAPRWRVKVIDFGTLRWSEADHRTALTRRDALLGTPAYMAPDQIVDPSTAGPKADLYSLGCVLHGMLAGRPPFVGTVEEVLEHHVITVPPVLPVALGLEKLAARLLEKIPADRPNSAGEVVDEVRRLGLDPGLAPPPPREPDETVSPSVMSPTPITTPTRDAHGSISFGPIDVRITAPSHAAPSSLTPSNAFSPPKPTPIWLPFGVLLTLLGVLAFVWFELRPDATPHRPEPVVPIAPAPPIEAPPVAASPTPPEALEPVRVDDLPSTPRPRPPPVTTPRPVAPPKSGLDLAGLKARLVRACDRAAVDRGELDDLPVVKAAFADYKAALSEAEAERADAALTTVERALGDPALPRQLVNLRLDRLGRILGQAGTKLSAEDVERIQRAYFSLGERSTSAQGSDELMGIARDASGLSAQIRQLTKE